MIREEPILVVRDLSVSYGDREVLHSVSFDVAQGNVVALLGDNGSGKSTLMKTVAGLVRQVKGDIFVGGKRINKLGAYSSHHLLS